MAPADAESLVRLALATRLGSISTSRGEWHLFSWVGWQVSRWLRPWAKSADRLFGGAPRVSPRPSPEAIHIFPCRLRGVGTSRVSLPRPRPGYVRTLRGIFSRAASCACESCRGQRAKPLSLVSCHSSSRRLLFLLQPDRFDRARVAATSISTASAQQLACAGDRMEYRECSEINRNVAQVIQID